MEGPCLPPYAMGTDVINFYLYCLFSLLNTAQKWMFIDISESSFFPTKLLQIWSKMRYFFLCLFLSGWQHNLSSISLVSPFPSFAPSLSIHLSICDFWATVKREDWMKTLKVLFSPPMSPFSPDYCVYFCSQALFLYYFPKSVILSCAERLCANGILCFLAHFFFYNLSLPLFLF